MNQVDPAGLKTQMQSTDVATNNWGTDNGIQFFHGYSFPGGNDNRGWGCETIVQNTAPVWLKYTGYTDNSTKFLEKIGYRCDNNGTCTENNSNHLGLLIKLLQQNSPEGHNVMAYINVNGTSVSPADSLKYKMWLDTFMGATTGTDIGGCGATYVSAFGDPNLHTNNQVMALAGTNGQGTNGSSTTEKYAIYAVHSDSSVTLDIYTAAEVGHTVAVPDGVGAKKSGSGNTSCGEIAAVLFQSKAPQDAGFTGNPTLNNKNDSWAKAYAEIVKKDPSAQRQVQNGGTVTTSPYDSCFITIPLLGWIMCALLNFADAMLVWFSSQVESLLFIGKNGLDDKGQLHQSWSSIKNITSVGILLIGLFMIMTQIFSFDFLSAYTAKKVLPRLLISAILIQLSWFIFKNFIFLIDAVGTGVQQLILKPFSADGSFSSLTINNILAAGNGTKDFSGGSSGALFAAMAAGVGAAAAGGMLGLVILALGVLIAILTAMFTLIIRNVLIFILLVLSPVALLAWILPGTQGLWKNWWSNFSKLLFMFPIIMLLFAGGVIGAKIISSTGSGIPSFLAALGAIVAYFGPLFLIPATFKYAGSAMAAASGGVSKLGGMVKEKNPVSKSLGKAAQVRQQSKETNAKLDSLSNSKFRRARGRFSTGVYGAKGEARTMMEAHEQSEAIKLESQKLEHDLRGMDGGQRTAALLAAASDKSGGVSRQRAAANALVGMSDVDSLRQLKATMKSNDQENMWNEVQSDNYSALKTLSPEMVNPDNFASTKLGESWDSLSTEQLAGMKPEGFKALQNWMADSSVPQAQRIAVQNKMTALASNPQLLAKADHSINEIQDMANASGALATRNTSEYIKTKRDPSTNAVIRQGTGAGTWRL